MPDEEPKRGPGQPPKICDEAIEIAYRALGTEYLSDTRRRLRKWYDDQGVTISKRTLDTIISRARARQVADLNIPKDVISGEIVKFYQDLAFSDKTSPLVKMKAMDAVREILGVGHQYKTVQTNDVERSRIIDSIRAAQAALSPAAVPSAGIVSDGSDAIQDLHVGTPERKDGDSQTENGVGPAGPESGTPGS